MAETFKKNYRRTLDLLTAEDFFCPLDPICTVVAELRSAVFNTNNYMMNVFFRSDVSGLTPQVRFTLKDEISNWYYARQSEGFQIDGNGFTRGNFLEERRLTNGLVWVLLRCSGFSELPSKFSRVGNNQNLLVAKSPSATMKSRTSRTTKTKTQLRIST